MALAAAGRAVEVVGRDLVRLAAAGRVPDRWMREPPASAAARDETAARVCEQARHEEEVESIRAAISKIDHAALAAYGGLNGAIARCVALKAAAAETRGLIPLITAGRDVAVRPLAKRNSPRGLQRRRTHSAHPPASEVDRFPAPSTPAVVGYCGIWLNHPFGNSLTLPTRHGKVSDSCRASFDASASRMKNRNSH